MIKRLTGAVVSQIAPQCRFERMIFVLGHMRCGSTALSNILCSRADISGYGEAHIRYDSRSALGILAINQFRRNAWNPRARYLFDKILHSRYDADPDADFFTAKAIFIVREPVATIRSIRKLFQTIRSVEYATDSLAADYYEERLAQLCTSWERFDPERRIGISYEELTAIPDTTLTRISEQLCLRPPLANHYAASSLPMSHGAGDPLTASKFNKIESGERCSSHADFGDSLDLSDSRIASLDKLYLQVIDNVIKAQ